jgi:ATP-dependent Lon protease
MLSLISTISKDLLLRFSTIFVKSNIEIMKTRKLTLPLFPLNMVLFPGETTKLYIFEQRYKQMVDDCLNNGASFGIAYTEKGKIQNFGTEVKINRVLKTYENGGMDILIEATGIFQILQFSEILSPKLYGAGIVEFNNSAQKIVLNSLQDATVNYFSTVQNKIIDYETVANLSVYSVASALQLTHPEKYRLVSAVNQQMHLLNTLNFIIHIINTEQQLKDRFVDN